MLAERIRSIQEHIIKLNNQVNNITVEPDPISRFKRNSIISIGIRSLHKGHSQAVGKIVPQYQGVFFDLFINDILDVETNELQYRITNLDFKVDQIETIGVIYQADGIMRVEKMFLTYSEQHQKYILTFSSNRLLGRILIVLNLIISLNNYHSNPTKLEPYPINTGPGNGGGCRPETCKNIINPFA